MFSMQLSSIDDPRWFCVRFSSKRLHIVARNIPLLYDDNRVMLMLSRGSANIRDVVLYTLSTGRLLYMIMFNINWRELQVNWRQVGDIILCRDTLVSRIVCCGLV